MNISKWRYLNTGYSDGYTNMAMDEAILTAVLMGQAPPTVRFYGWRPPTVSIGYFQNLDKVIDIKACENFGFDIVRRPTGGKMVLHDMELTYSVIVREEQQTLRGDILSTYMVISQALVQGLKKLGVDAQMTPLKGREKKGLSLYSAACFSALSSYEVTAGGKKLIGSAQKRHRDGIMQHGSILIGLDLEKLLTVQKFKTSEHREAMRKFLSQRITCISELLQRKVDFWEVAEAMRSGFQGRFKDSLEAGSLSTVEEELMQTLREGKYRTEEWNLRRGSGTGV